jgi:hypothetical protein
LNHITIIIKKIANMGEESTEVIAAATSIEATEAATEAAATKTTNADTDADIDADTDTNVETKKEEETAASASSEGAGEGGEKRKLDDDETATAAASTTATSSPSKIVSKKAKIAMPPSVSSNITDVDKYALEDLPPADNTNEKDAEAKITTPNLMLFGLHPLIKESPLTKLLEDYGEVKAVTVRSAFASRYGHVSFSTIDEARKCYIAIHGAKLLHKTFLVQPSAAAAEPSKKATKEAASAWATEDSSAGEAAAAAAAAAASAAAASAAASASAVTTD